MATCQQTRVPKFLYILHIVNSISHCMGELIPRLWQKQNSANWVRQPHVSRLQEIKSTKHGARVQKITGCQTRAESVEITCWNLLYFNPVAQA